MRTCFNTPLVHALALSSSATLASAMGSASGRCDPEIRIAAPASACLVTVYLAGSQSLAPIYATASGTVLPNPFSSDAAGLWIFFAPDGRYSLTFSRSDRSPPPGTRNHEVAIVDPGFNSPTVGARSRTKNSKLADILSIKDFGAAGDGVTDDSQALVTAISLSSLSTCIVFPDGTYVTSVALVARHPVCFTGHAWRLVYKGAEAPIRAVLSLIGDPVPDHSRLMQGGKIEGAVFDGQGRSTFGLILQGVVSARMLALRATNVIDAGFYCHWCQQVTFDSLTVSQNFEPFQFVPARGLVLDAISTANIFNQVNIDNVRGNGIDIEYGSANMFNGGASEGVGGWGVYCAGAAAPHFCFANSFLNLDTEENQQGDYYFATRSYFNTVVAPNSSSKTGLHFAGTANSNTVIGGFIGASVADSQTFGNRLINVSAIITGGRLPWTDNGHNSADPIYNEFTATTQTPSKPTAADTSSGISRALCAKTDNTLGSCQSSVKPDGSCICK